MKINSGVGCHTTITYVSLPDPSLSLVTDERKARQATVALLRVGMEVTMDTFATSRLQWAEHTYTTPTRNLHSEQQRKRVRLSGPASEVRYGYRAKDGTTYMFPTASEMAEFRKQELVNAALERQQRQQRIIDIANSQCAEIDSWASKS